MTSENEFLRALSHQFPARRPVTLGIGDDGAILDVSADSSLVVVTDLLLDQVHFDLRSISSRLAGRKAIAVNLSDLAAMAALPTGAFVSLAIPRDTCGHTPHFLRVLYRGMLELCDEWKFCIAGGDTNSWNGPFAINVCLTGRLMTDRSVLRSGAHEGDRIFVTGPLGGSLTSQRHLLFNPRFDAAEWLVRNTAVSSMMDISDGLATDLVRLAEASGVGAVLNAARIPVHDDVAGQGQTAERVASAVGDGEDFELLFTLPELECQKLEQAPSKLKFYEIGSISPDTGIRWIDLDGTVRPLPASGWQHDF